MDKWLKVSLIVNGELAEAVAEVLARYAPEGVAIEATAIAVNPEDEGEPVGPLCVYAFLPIDEKLEERCHQLEQALWYLGRISPLPEPQFETIQETNWMEAWKEHYKPIPIGKSLIIVPSWLEAQTAGRIPVRIDPGMAFGTGTHPTTQLCLEMLEQELHDERVSLPKTMIDIGCGSGILAVAALKLGVERALGVDIDPEAMASARQNAEINGVAKRLELGIGSVNEIRQGAFSMREAPLVIANIIAPVLLRLLGEGLGELVTTGGKLILSGILEEQEAEIREALLRHGFEVPCRLQQGDWVSLTTTMRQHREGEL